MEHTEGSSFPYPEIARKCLDSKKWARQV